MANEYGRGWDCGLVDEISEDGGYDVINVRCEGYIPLFPFGVGITERKVVEDVGCKEVWEFLDEAL